MKLDIELTQKTALQQLKIIKDAFGCDLAYYGNEMTTAYHVVEAYIHKKEKQLNICIFGKYKVEYKCKFTVIDEERYFTKDKVESKHTWDGYQLLEKIIELIKDSMFISLYAEENKIVIDHFNENTGETAEYTISFASIIKNKGGN